jgi:hypothetical protein
MNKSSHLEDLGTEWLKKFLDSHDLHLLADPTEAVSIGSIYKRDPNELRPKARVIGNTLNFIVPSVTLPDLKKGSQKPINENFRDERSLSFIAKAVTGFISRIGFSIDSEKEKILEVNYDKVTYESVDLVDFGDLFQGHRFKTENWQYKPDYEYYVVTRLARSGNFKVVLRVSKNLRTILDANHGEPVIEGSVEMKYASKEYDEVVMTYSGDKALVFAVHLEYLFFEKNSGNLIDMKPLSQVIQVLDTGNRILE